MTVTINGTTGIDKVQDGSIQAADLASGVPSRSQLPAGTVLQVVSATTSSTTSTTSSTYQPTSLTASITPSSSTSKILAFVSGGDFDSKAGGRQLAAAIARNGTVLSPSTDVYADTTRIIVPTSVCVNDAPATTSSVTYALYVKSRTSNDVGFNTQGEIATITLMEIAA